MCVSIGPFLPSISISLHFATVKEPFDPSPQAHESLEPPIFQSNNILSNPGTRTTPQLIMEVYTNSH
ncbi:hypothetical protein Hanom_Chr16g01448431 [Helianthus anomalus]